MRDRSYLGTAVPAVPAMPAVPARGTHTHTYERSAAISAAAWLPLCHRLRLPPGRPPTRQPARTWYGPRSHQPSNYTTTPSCARALPGPACPALPALSAPALSAPALAAPAASLCFAVLRFASAAAAAAAAAARLLLYSPPLPFFCARRVAPLRLAQRPENVAQSEPRSHTRFVTVYIRAPLPRPGSLYWGRSHSLKMVNFCMKIQSRLHFPAQHN